MHASGLKIIGHDTIFLTDVRYISIDGRYSAVVTYLPDGTSKTDRKAFHHLSCIFDGNG